MTEDQYDSLLAERHRMVLLALLDKIGIRYDEVIPSLAFPEEASVERALRGLDQHVRGANPTEPEPVCPRIP